LIPADVAFVCVLADVCIAAETGQQFVSRDLNAALNIRRILIGPRPIILCRQGVMQRLEQHIVKRLRGR
jgi:hypothetical protein